MPDDQIVVTGASKGIGAAIARELATRGHQVVCLSRSGKAPAGYGISCDMTDETSVVAAFKEVASNGSVAGLVNNAGVHMGSPSATLQTSEFDQVMRLNATAVMIAAREVYPFLKNKGGVIVNIGSFFDKLGVPDSLAYCASKAAVGAMTRCLAVEWASAGINVMNVAPGYIETDLNRVFLAQENVKRWMSKRIPTGAPGKPADVAQLVAVLFGENIPFLTGETIYIDGAQGVNH